MSPKCRNVCLTIWTALSLFVTIIGITTVTTIRYDNLICDITPGVVEECIKYTREGYNEWPVDDSRILEDNITISPTQQPSNPPTNPPTAAATNPPTVAVTDYPSHAPTMAPTMSPTINMTIDYFCETPVNTMSLLEAQKQMASGWVVLVCGWVMIFFTYVTHIFIGVTPEENPATKVEMDSLAEFELSELADFSDTGLAII